MGKRIAEFDIFQTISSPFALLQDFVVLKTKNKGKTEQKF